MQNTSLMHFLQIPPFLALQVHYEPSQRGVQYTRDGEGNLINGRTNAGEANYPFIPFRIFVRNIYPPIYFPFLCARSIPRPLSTARINVFTPASRGAPRSTGECEGCSLNLPP